MKHMLMACLALLPLAAACGPYTTDAHPTASANAELAASAAYAPCEPSVPATSTAAPSTTTATIRDIASAPTAHETPTPVDPSASPTTASPNVSPTACPTSASKPTVQSTSTATTAPAAPSTPAPTPPSPPQLTPTWTPTLQSVPTPDASSVAITATARAGPEPIAYLSIGDGIQWGCCGPLESSSAAIFRRYLEGRVGRPTIWQTTGSGYQTTDTFISNGTSESQLDFAVKLIGRYRADGVPIAAITLSIGGNNLVDIGRACASPPCTDLFIAGVAHLRAQLDVIYSRVVAAKDEHTPLLVLLYYDSYECSHNPYSGPSVDAWNAVIAEVAAKYGAHLVDARSLFRGHCDWIDVNGLDASAKGHAALAAEYERVYESLPPSQRLP